MRDLLCLRGREYTGNMTSLFSCIITTINHTYEWRLAILLLIFIILSILNLARAFLLLLMWSLLNSWLQSLKVIFCPSHIFAHDIRVAENESQPLASLSKRSSVSAAQ